MKEYEHLYKSLIELNESTKLKLISERLTNAESKVINKVQEYIKNKPSQSLDNFVITVDLESPEELVQLTTILNTKGLLCTSKYTPVTHSRYDPSTPDIYEILIKL